ncbi:CCA tRNA nucleotidyltransferase [Paenibacillus montanisoli]|uniref:CCA tRNA nucleotidyltransferase n=1 Tax=Paenibacillus montanisoli TaxID=2081970 RepID=A0A328U8F5_9BACL|nr:CCA tRNA nucleotidyltransferase [Paenibacillus montanisoli]RAP76356.1 CCA tRNA nucleotidyltransferase [Paenibacillus montanisoli]
MSWSDALTKALPLLHALERSGHEAVFVGGCVRDTLSGRALKDVDIATSAEPEEVIAAFPNTIPTGLQHGTVTVVHEKETYEVTTFRTESAYEKFRRPSQVQFVKSLDEDLLRRDFTINSMAMRADGTVYDPFGGQRDLRSGLLRCVGDPDARLQEDALRIVRAVRFASGFHLRIALRTWRAVLRHRHLLAHIAMERIGLELDKMVGGRDPARAAAYLAVSGMLHDTKEGLPQTLLDAAERYRARRKLRGDAASAAESRMLAAIQAVQALDGIEDRWAAICCALGFKEGQAAQLFAVLRYSTARSSQLTAVTAIHQDMLECPSLNEDTRRKWTGTILGRGKSAAIQWLRLVEAIPVLSPADLDQSGYLAQLKEWKQGMQASTNKELAIKGTDLLAIRKEPSGPWLGKLLGELLQAVALGELPNEKQALLQAAADAAPSHFQRPADEGEST